MYGGVVGVLWDIMAPVAVVQVGAQVLHVILLLLPDGRALHLPLGGGLLPVQADLLLLMPLLQLLLPRPGRR